MSKTVWSATKGWHDGDDVQVSSVAALNSRADIQFVSDSQDVATIREHVGDAAQQYDSFFVGVKDGDYVEIWGMCGIVPHLSKMVTRLV